MPAVWRTVPRARLLLVGNSPPVEIQALSSEGVAVVGYVPDLTPYYGSARMSVSPIRYGSGVKGKIVESLHAGVPVVTTTVGGEGIDLESGVDALFGETAEEIATQVVRLFEDVELLNALALAGRRVIAERYSRESGNKALFAALDLGARVPRETGVSHHPAA